MKRQMNPPKVEYRTPQKPKDVPEIVNGYIDLVASLVHEYAKKVNAPGAEMKPADVKNIIGLGRSVAMLQVIEVNKLANVGHKAVKDLTTEEIETRLREAGNGEVLQLPEYTEEEQDDE